ncbi:MAG: hypothetical protein IJD13_08880 [Oscillospiraceae bacterium]|nr:hypothetical protein [Oscillospiraceae bacterium]
MKKAYKQAMDQIAVSDHMRTRILAKTAKPKNRYGWVRTACGAAACFALLCTVGYVGLQTLDAAPEAAMDAGMNGANKTAAPAEGAFDVLEDSIESEAYSFSAGETAMEEAADGSAKADMKSEPDTDDIPAAEPTEDTPDVLIANPVVKYKYLEDALPVLEFMPVVPVEAINGDVTVIGGEVLQLCWEQDGVDYTYRTALGDADVSGIYTSRKYTEVAQLDDCDTSFPVEFSGDGNTFSLALWKRDGMTFSLFAEPGTDMDALIEIIG